MPNFTSRKPGDSGSENQAEAVPVMKAGSPWGGWVFRRLARLRGFVLRAKGEGALKNGADSAG